MASYHNACRSQFIENCADLPIQKLLRGTYLYSPIVQPLTMILDQYSSQSCLGSPTSCHLRVINTSLSIMHAGRRISNIWLDNKFIPSIRERSFLWPSGYLLFFRNELHGIFLSGGKNDEDKGNFLIKITVACSPCPQTTNLR